MKSQIVLFLAIIASSLYGSLAEPDAAESKFCLLKDPPKQCGEFCLTALKPLIDHFALHQNQWNIRDAVIVNETQAKLNRIEGKLAAQEAELNSLKSQQTALDNTLLNLQKTLSKIEGIPQNFMRIGSKYFHVEQNLMKNWTSAITTCIQMGGHLASIKDGREFDAIVAQLRPGTTYRIDINDLAETGQFVSNTSGKLATFLKWYEGEPRYEHSDQHCVTIHNGRMWNDSCDLTHLFICQANDEE